MSQIKITLSSKAITADIQAMAAMRNYMNGGATPLLTDDHADAINIAVGDAFLMTLMRLASYVTAHDISPEDYYDAGQAELMMSAELTTSARLPDATVPLLRRQAEHAVACRALAAVAADTATAAEYRSAADAAIETVRDLLDATDSPIARILPSR